MAKKILIVDDDLSVRTLFEEELRGAGFEVITAADGMSGLSELQKGGYDLVLLDVMMPQLDGVGVLTTLQENPPAIPNKKIILFTSLHDDPAVEEGMKLGASGSLIKSDLSPELLLSKIKELA